MTIDANAKAKKIQVWASIDISLQSPLFCASCLFAPINITGYSPSADLNYRHDKRNVRTSREARDVRCLTNDVRMSLHCTSCSVDMCTTKWRSLNNDPNPPIPGY